MNKVEVLEILTDPLCIAFLFFHLPNTSLYFQDWVLKIPSLYFHDSATERIKLHTSALGNGGTSQHMPMIGYWGLGCWQWGRGVGMLGAWGIGFFSNSSQSPETRYVKTLKLQRREYRTIRTSNVLHGSQYTSNQRKYKTVKYKTVEQYTDRKSQAIKTPHSGGVLFGSYHSVSAGFSLRQPSFRPDFCISLLASRSVTPLFIISANCGLVA